MTEIITLDPSAIDSSRTAVEITSFVSVDGPDWGDAAVQAYMAEQQIGSSPVDYRLPNRTIKIPLKLRDVSGTSFSSIRLSLQQKVALFQREGGSIMRQVGSTPLYADIVDATLHLGGDYMQAFRSADVTAVLTLECLPDWYGAEVTLDTLTATGVLVSKLQASSADAVIAGNYPGRCRIIVTDTSSNDQHGLLWGLRARHYDSASTAALSYEAEALTPLNAAATATLTGASGGSVVQHTSLPAGAWVAMLVTNLVSGNLPLTHVGSYRVRVRAYSATATPQLRLQWGVGSLSTPVTNDIVQLPGSGSFYMLDLGQIRLDAPPVGSMQWFGAIQAKAAVTNDPVAIDRVYLQPLDESAGTLIYQAVAPASAIGTTAAAGTGADDSGTGTISWTSTGLITAKDNNPAVAAIPAGPGTVVTTHWLKATNFGFAIPSTATVRGIVGNVVRRYPVADRTATDTGVRLVKAGTVQATDRSSGAAWPTSFATASYGSATDLWGGTWAPADINNSGFGLAISASAAETDGENLYVDYMSITVYYTLASGFTVTQDAVVYASRIAELRTEGMFRQDSTGSVYGPVSRYSDVPRLPPSGIESRPVELFVKPTRGDLAQLADSGLDSFTAQVKYRPSYLYVAA